MSESKFAMIETGKKIEIGGIEQSSIKWDVSGLA